MLKEGKMSLTRPRTSTNPASKFIRYHGDTGKWGWWDKQNEENVELKLPVYFVVLDELFTIKGWSKQYEGIYSNEVHTTNELLKVKSFKNNLTITGYYSDIKDEINGKGGKYTKSVYAMLFDNEGNTEMVNFQISGAALGAWFEAKVKANSQSVGIMVETIDGKNGSIEYKIPVFKSFKFPSEEIMTDAYAFDEQLQKYLDEYKKTKEDKEAEEEVYNQETIDERNVLEEKHFSAADNYEDEENEDLPF